MNLLNVLIETERLTLKSISYDYTEEICMEFIPKLQKKIAQKAFVNIEKSKKMIEKSLKEIENRTALKMVIINKYSNEFIGLIELNEINTIEPFIEIWIKKASRKIGYGLEAMNGLLEWANENIEFNCIYYSLRKRTIIKRKESKKNNGKTIRVYKIIGPGKN
jgi:[ribosomal protein S5]-alanine N-acetyltransferase